MRYVFGNYTLDSERYELRQAGTLVALEPRVFNLLACLVKHPDATLTREELCAQVWPNQVIVTDDSLTKCVEQARKALGDTGQVRQYIQTVRRRGYRFIAAVGVRPGAATDVSGTASRPDTVWPGLLDAERWQLRGTDLGTLTPFVGRHTEVTLLQERWAQSRDGPGQVVLLSGEPGIGKSRLVRELQQRLAGEPSLQLECRGSPYYQHSTLYPVIELWQRLLQWQRDDVAAAKVSKLEATLVSYDVSLPEVMPLFTALLSLPQGDSYPPLALPPERQKQRTLEALLVVLLAMAAQQPILLVVEDLHWADPGTVEWLSLLIEQVPTFRLLVVLVFRPEFCPPWPSRAYLTSLTLSRLPSSQVERMLAELTRDKPLPVVVRQELLVKTDGVPLFVEEMTKMVLESSWLQEQEDHYALTGPLSPLAIPSTLHDSLMARLERLGTGKEVAQLGATIGREFPYEVLQAVASLEEASLQGALANLVAAEVLYHRGLPPQRHYVFKHALLQDAAYASLPTSTRRHYHQQIAHVVATRLPHLVETQPELLAHHYTEAGLSAAAVDYWQRAGMRASQRAFYGEAVNHLTKALVLLTTLPDTLERARRELDMQLTLSRALQVTRGSGDSERGYTLVRARALCRQVGDTPQLFRVLGGLAGFSLFRGELHTARDLAEQRLILAQGQADPACRLQAHIDLAEPLFYLGEMVAARAHLAQASALALRQHDRASDILADEDAMVRCLGYTARALWKLGYPDQALARIHEMLAYAEASSHAFTLLRALYYAALIHMGRRDGAATQQRIEAILALMSEQGLGFNAGYVTLVRGWVLAAQDQREEGLAQMHQGLGTLRATGTRLGETWSLPPLAEAYGASGQAEEGLRLLAEALAHVDRTGERFYEAEVYRLKGELLLQQAVPDAPQAETCFQQALSVARRQQARTWELRTATSLSQLWQQQGKCVAARQVLAEIYDWFTEGFDLADLQEARALLADLA